MSSKALKEWLSSIFTLLNNSEIILFDLSHSMFYELNHVGQHTFLLQHSFLARSGYLWVIFRTASLLYGARLGTQLFNMTGEPLGFAAAFQV